MPGLCYRNQHQTVNCGYKNTCECQNCPCRSFKSKRLQNSQNDVPKNAIVFQLPKYREPVSDTYSHTVYKKEYCNRTLMKQHVALAQKKASQRPKVPPIFEQERFASKSTTASDYHRYHWKDAVSCKANFPITKGTEDFYFRPGEYSCTAKFTQQPVSHDDYCPKVPIASDCQRFERDCCLPPFEGISCYKQDYNVPPPEAYSKNRIPRKRVIFN